MNPEDEAEEDGANIDLDSQRKGKCVVLKTSTRQVKWMNIFILLANEIVLIQISNLLLLFQILRYLVLLWLFLSCAFSERS